ncbi:MAG: hypothetical protein HZB29_03655 [Nitrospinae bacterium]|nr:hypothetical protein [Nitrospinota bacterium]
MNGSAGLKTLYVFMMGFFLALTQTGFFFGMEIFFTSAFAGFGAVAGGWLLGSAAGLFIAKARIWGSGAVRAQIAHIALCLAAYYALQWGLRTAPFDTALAPVYIVLIAVSGSQAGAFFARSGGIFPTASRLYLWENNGFIAGWVAGFAGYVFMGSGFTLWAPALAAALTASLGNRAHKA